MGAPTRSAQNLELLAGRRAEGVAGAEEHRPPGCLQLGGELADGGGLARAVDAHDHHDPGTGVADGEAAGVELAVQGQDAGDVLPERVLEPRRVRELLARHAGAGVLEQRGGGAHADVGGEQHFLEAGEDPLVHRLLAGEQAGESRHESTASAGQAVGERLAGLGLDAATPLLLLAPVRLLRLVGLALLPLAGEALLLLARGAPALALLSLGLLLAAVLLLLARLGRTEIGGSGGRGRGRREDLGGGRGLELALESPRPGRADQGEGRGGAGLGARRPGRRAPPARRGRRCQRRRWRSGRGWESRRGKGSGGPQHIGAAGAGCQRARSGPATPPPTGRARRGAPTRASRCPAPPSSRRRGCPPSPSCACCA